MTVSSLALLQKRVTMTEKQRDTDTYSLAADSACPHGADKISRASGSFYTFLTDTHRETKKKTEKETHRQTRQTQTNTYSFAAVGSVLICCRIICMTGSDMISRTSGSFIAFLARSSRFPPYMP
jgi:hypothetical protein